MYGIGVDISRFVKGLWLGEKQPRLGSSYDPDIKLALDDFETELLEKPDIGGAPLPAE